MTESTIDPQLTLDPKRTRRVKLLAVSPEFLIDFLTETEPVELMFEGMPKDAQATTAHFDFQRACFFIPVYSAEFPPVPAGEWPELFSVKVRWLRRPGLKGPVPQERYSSQKYGAWVER